MFLKAFIVVWGIITTVIAATAAALVAVSLIPGVSLAGGIMSYPADMEWIVGLSFATPLVIVTCIGFAITTAVFEELDR
jgi:hypothetical protein